VNKTAPLAKGGIVRGVKTFIAETTPTRQPTLTSPPT